MVTNLRHSEEIADALRGKLRMGNEWPLVNRLYPTQEIQVRRNGDIVLTPRVARRLLKIVTFVERLWSNVGVLFSDIRDDE